MPGRAFTLSYDALHQLALDSQVRPSLAWLWPVVIDGTIVVALLTVLAANRAARSAGYPWTLAGLFSAASVAFNVAHTPDRPVAQLVFAMAPVALVLTTHLLMQQVGWRRLDNGPVLGMAAKPDGEARPMLADMVAGTFPAERRMSGPTLDHAGPDRDPAPGMGGHAPDTLGHGATSRPAMAGPKADLQAQARRLYQEYRATGRRISGAALARQLDTSERHGRRLLAELRAREEGFARRNSDGAARHEQAGPQSR
jgi:hypothetical protein